VTAEGLTTGRNNFRITELRPQSMARVPWSGSCSPSLISGLRTGRTTSADSAFYGQLEKISQRPA